ncbi:MAG: type II toxin-antitoxin system HicA family toxin [Armatimonadota bacterium]
MRAGPANVLFRDLCRLVEHVGYVERRRAGSHRIYRHGTRSELPLINLQEGSAGKAKPYQVRQVLAIVDAYALEVDS